MSIVDGIRLAECTLSNIIYLSFLLTLFLVCILLEGSFEN